jgi:hypothetical protein
MVQADGSLWVLGQFNPGSGEVSLRRLDRRSGAILDVIGLPLAVAAEWGGDGLVVGGGYVWGTGLQGATIYRIDPIDSDVTTFRLDGRAASNLAFDQNAGTLWAMVTGKQDEASIVEVDPENGTVLSSTPFQLEWASGLLPAGDTVWVMGREVNNQTVQGGFLHQITPGGSPDIPTGGSFALPVTDGETIWTTASGDEAAMNLASGIAQVEPTDGSILDSWKVRGVGYDIAIGPDRGVWFLGPRGLERLNPSTGEIDAWPTPKGSAATFIVPTSAGVWVGTYEGALEFRSFERPDCSFLDPGCPDHEVLVDLLERSGFTMAGDTGSALLAEKGPLVVSAFVAGPPGLPISGEPNQMISGTVVTRYDEDTVYWQTPSGRQVVIRIQTRKGQLDHRTLVALVEASLAG